MSVSNYTLSLTLPNLVAICSSILIAGTKMDEANAMTQAVRLCLAADEAVTNPTEDAIRRSLETIHAKQTLGNEDAGT